VALSNAKQWPQSARQSELIETTGQIVLGGHMAVVNGSARLIAGLERHRNVEFQPSDYFVDVRCKNWPFGYLCYTIEPLGLFHQEGINRSSLGLRGSAIHVAPQG
jgi:hypothetical protein